MGREGGNAQWAHSSLVSPETEYGQAPDGRWWTFSTEDGTAVEFATREVKEAVNGDHSADLSSFGYGKYAAADLVRFIRPSMVVDDVRATFHGLRGGRRPGWSAADQLKEGEFIADTQSMLLRSFANDRR